jgi:hypothetical protein
MLTLTRVMLATLLAPPLVVMTPFGVQPASINASIAARVNLIP